MTDERQKYIERLVELFFDGGTTTAQERELYDFFDGDLVPEHLWQYKSVFTYFESGIGAEIAELDHEGQGTEAIVPGGGKYRGERIARRDALMRFLLPAMAVASLLALFFFGPSPGETSGGGYESFIVRDGVKITDPEIVMPEVEAVLNIINREMQAYEKLEQFIAEIENSSLPAGVKTNTNTQN